MRLEQKAATVGPESGLIGADDDTGVVEALVSVTGVVDNDGDIIEPGSYAETLVRRKPKGIFAHDWQKWASRTEVVEEWLPGDPRLPKKTRDGKPWPTGAGALYVKTRYNLATDTGRNAYHDVKFFSQSGECEWSIGYRVPKGKATRGKDGVRRIKGVDLYEYSPVLFGANSMSGTLAVKSALSETSEDVDADEDDYEPIGDADTDAADDGLGELAESADNTLIEESALEELDEHADTYDDTKALFDLSPPPMGDPMSVFREFRALKVPDISDPVMRDRMHAALFRLGQALDSGNYNQAKVELDIVLSQLRDAGADPEIESFTSGASAILRRASQAMDVTFIPGKGENSGDVDNKGARQWLERLHPRDGDGQFTDKPDGGGSSGDDMLDALNALKVGEVREIHSELAVQRMKDHYLLLTPGGKRNNWKPFARAESAQELVDAIRHRRRSSASSEPNNRSPWGSGARGPMKAADGDDMEEKLAHESLNRSPKKNWVELAGQLPAYIQHIAKDLHEEKGMPLDRAIATAISAVKRWARGGGNVNADTREKAAKAVAEWEELKAKSKARRATKDDTPETLESSRFPWLPGTFEELREQIREAATKALDADHVEVLGTWPDFAVVTAFGDDGVKTLEVPYVMNGDGQVELEDPQPVQVSVTVDGGSEDGEKMLPFPSMIEEAVAGLKAYLVHAGNDEGETKAGRVLSGVNAERLKSVVEQLVGLLRTAGVKVALKSDDPDEVDMSPQANPPMPDTTAPSAQEGKVLLDPALLARALHIRAEAGLRR